MRVLRSSHTHLKQGSEAGPFSKPPVTSQRVVMEKSSEFGDVEGRLFRCHSQENMKPCGKACRRCRAKRT